jgi:hypothetical protein
MECQIPLFVKVFVGFCYILVLGFCVKKYPKETMLAIGICITIFLLGYFGGLTMDKNIFFVSLASPVVYGMLYSVNVLFR